MIRMGPRASFMRRLKRTRRLLRYSSTRGAMWRTDESVGNRHKKYVSVSCRVQ